MELYGVRLVGVSGATGQKLLFTTVLVLAFLALRFVLARLARRASVERGDLRVRFWTEQGVNIASSVVLVLGLLSIWFDNPENLATGIGLVTAGLAFALQKVVTAIAGYFVVLRGNTFKVGDRIVIGGVRGDVIALGFMQTTIMEMGQPPPVQADEPAVWVAGRQYTGRIVSVSNARIFDDAVYNYSRDFPLIWEEMRIPVPYAADRGEAERILLDCAAAHARTTREVGEAAVVAMTRRYGLPPPDLEPRVFYRITDNWLELALRFVAPVHGSRVMKDAMTREILARFEAAGIAIASATYDVVGLPTVQVRAAADGAKSEPREGDAP